MPTFRDPLTDAAEASEAMRGLAHASRVFDDPADTYTVFGDLTATMRSLRQVLDQLANTHLAHRDRAQHDDGDHLAGDRSALAAADELHRAGTLLDQAHDHLNTAFSHSGRIAWHPEPVVDRDAARERLAARLDGDPATTTVQAGTLTLTVWPDTPAGEHQRYAYRIIDTTTGRELEGRDLFTGAGQPVDPDHAIRDLATFLGAAGEARQYALDHPDSTPEHTGLFPEWVAEAARTNADALTELTEPAEPAPASEASGTGRQWISVVFLQGDEADEVLDLIDAQGTDAAIEYLTGYDYGDETVEAAIANGHVYDKPQAGALDRTATRDVYTLTYSTFLGHVGLYREANALPDPALLGIDTPINVGPAADATTTATESAPARRSTGPAGRDWFAGPAGGEATGRRGLSL